jgi:hypothetical protein
MNLARKLGCKAVSRAGSPVTGCDPMFRPTQPTISGTVSDGTGATIPGASVTAAEISTGIATTVPSGSHSFLALPPERQMTGACGQVSQVKREGIPMILEGRAEKVASSDC